VASAVPALTKYAIFIFRDHLTPGIPWQWAVTTGRRVHKPPLDVLNLESAESSEPLWVNILRNPVELP